MTLHETSFTPCCGVCVFSCELWDYLKQERGVLGSTDCEGLGGCPRDAGPTLGSSWEAIQGGRVTGNASAWAFCTPRPVDFKAD